MQNARLDELQTGIKMARRNINNLRYADDTTLMAESKEKLKSFQMRVKDKSEKASFFNSPVSLSSRGSLVPLYFLPLEWCNLHI